MNIGNRLMELRKGLHLSQEEVADKLNVTRQTISKWETDQSMPDFDKIMPICELYNITPDELLTGVKKEENINNDENSIKREKKTKCLVISIFIYILAFIWLIVSVPVLRINAILGFAGTVFISAIATCIIVYSSIVYKIEKKVKKEDTIIKTIDNILSIITVIIYFVISFTTMMWHITWIIFLIYELIIQIIKLVFSLRSKENE